MANAPTKYQIKLWVGFDFDDEDDLNEIDQDLYDMDYDDLEDEESW